MKSMKALLLIAQGRKCAYCSTDINWETATFEHVVPLSKGGTNEGNRVLACRECNQAKADRMPDQRERLIAKAVNAAVTLRGKTRLQRKVKFNAAPKSNERAREVLKRRIAMKTKAMLASYEDED